MVQQMSSFFLLSTHLPIQTNTVCVYTVELGVGVGDTSILRGGWIEGEAN